MKSVRRIVAGFLAVAGICVSAWSHFAHQHYEQARSATVHTWEEQPSFLEVASRTGVLNGLPLLGLAIVIIQWPDE